MILSVFTMYFLPSEIFKDLYKHILTYPHKTSCKVEMNCSPQMQKLHHNEAGQFAQSHIMLETESRNLFLLLCFNYSMTIP